MSHKLYSNNDELFLKREEINKLKKEVLFEGHEEAKKLYDEKFCRMWEFYLTSCEIGFRQNGLMVFQLQLAKKQDAVPLTRNYIDDWEREIVAREDRAAE